jgi:DMSO/TMAO reductase YedYZ molybdopterin-dependent catalytic subunit
VLTVTGMVRHPLQLRVAELRALPRRREQRSDLHCVTTWSALDLNWGGLPFKVLHDQLVARAAVRASARWVSNGAPLRMVAPAHYGYKSVKHLYAIEYRHAYDPGPAGWKAHPRGRVAQEERSRYLPGRVWRPVWRAGQPLVRRAYDRRTGT